jgi:hypothetical protein
MRTITFQNRATELRDSDGQISRLLDRTRGGTLILAVLEPSHEKVAASVSQRYSALFF